MDSTFVFYCILIILVAEFLLATALNFLNAQKFKDPVPKDLEDVYNIKEYEKSQAYKLTNYRFGILTSTFSLALILGFIVFGGFNWVDQIAQNSTDHPIGQALLFFGIILLGSDIINIPFTYYQTFVIEEKFGFNKTTHNTFILDKIKQWALTLIVGGGILALIIWFFQTVGTNFWWYTWIAIAFFTLIVNLFYSKLIVPLFNKQEPLEAGSLKEKIEHYAANVGFDLKHIFVINGSKRSTKANAYFSGFGKEKRVTLYDTLINDLEEEEIVAVLAHEVGHYKRKHIIFNLASSILLTGLMLFLLSLFINNPELSLAIGVDRPSFHAALIGFGILYSPVSELTGLLMNYFSRKFEYQADDYAKNTYAATPLVTSLKKLSKNSLSNLTPHPAYVFMHYSHPPLIDRIRNLKA
ncbi:STE24 endopeptidase [Maribacter sedimenticola]|uniref:STE24 endopeptidase n=1 Tax=Maribacter sedimenticola TaxID=228956 RepID=A0ABY1SK60_9FLAO|nr:MULTISPECIES: M48 family metallopeptidase [Maribacter]TVZ17384.1 STE24 endopeptidase [Maribacter sp. MAR_2009_72]SNR68321.1 STE24 endopeptidase [Maribacter sedimenticola]